MPSEATRSQSIVETKTDCLVGRREETGPSTRRSVCFWRRVVISYTKGRRVGVVRQQWSNPSFPGRFVFCWMTRGRVWVEAQRGKRVRQKSPTERRHVCMGVGGSDEDVFFLPCVAACLKPSFPPIPTCCLYYSSRSMLVHPLFKCRLPWQVSNMHVLIMLTRICSWKLPLLHTILVGKWLSLAATDEVHRRQRDCHSGAAISKYLIMHYWQQERMKDMFGFIHPKDHYEISTTISLQPRGTRKRNLGFHHGQMGKRMANDGRDNGWRCQLTRWKHGTDSE